jgi:hypothetical protein
MTQNNGKIIALYISIFTFLGGREEDRSKQANKQTFPEFKLLLVVSKFNFDLLLLFKNTLTELRFRNVYAY